MKLFGVINCSTDSHRPETVVRGPEEARRFADRLIADGADYIDLGGQGSRAGVAAIVSPEQEWSRLSEIIPALAADGHTISVDTWRPLVAAQAFTAGATILNATDGLQSDEMATFAAKAECLTILPFLNGPNPLEIESVSTNPVNAITDFFDTQLPRLARLGIKREQLILDIGVGFGHCGWDEDERFSYQRSLYENLYRFRRFELPLYIAVPVIESPLQEEFLELILSADIEYGRCHRPAEVRMIERRQTTS